MFGWLAGWLVGIALWARKGEERKRRSKKRGRGWE
jgi:hypothetical protein